MEWVALVIDSGNGVLSFSTTLEDSNGVQGAEALQCEISVPVSGFAECQIQADLLSEYGVFIASATETGFFTYGSIVVSFAVGA